MSGGRGCFNCGGCALSLSLPLPHLSFRTHYISHLPGTLLTMFLSVFFICPLCTARGRMRTNISFHNYGDDNANLTITGTRCKYGDAH
ncbi:hypothetical protein B0H12DRAFT_1103206 [Mycena haematopus]|nr:hypothetical protein B0H12DRAFT_1103206 [Mycena haematopus]